ncbi:MAG TPA: fibronectin type III domain-containing protein [Solirubrobacteraceae bacterium]|jgi:hypothetical protein|nr:fibronectin type III domain-containing protein [Solirubrobacteraceae bacterium]
MSDLDDRDDGPLAGRPRVGARIPRAHRLAAALLGGVALAGVPGLAAASSRPPRALLCPTAAVCIGIGVVVSTGGVPAPTTTTAPPPPAPLVPPPAPLVSLPAQGARVLGSSSSQLQGAVDPEGQATTYAFQWGRTVEYGHTVPSTPAEIAAGSATVNVSQTLTDLSPATTYHFRLVATSAAGATYGPDRSFTTLPLPVLGKTVNVMPISGTVLIQAPSKHKAKHKAKRQPFVPLTQSREIPVGSTLNTTKGTVELFSATARHSTVNDLRSGDFSDGTFQVRQTRKQKGLTTLALTGGRDRARVCGSAHEPNGATAARLSSTVLRLLKSSAHGRFSTKGRYSSATVRGSQWETIDQCDGTVTRVERGAVSVEVFRTRRRIILRAGGRFLAEA